MVSGKLDLSVMIGNHCVNMVDYDSETPVEDGDETQIQVGADMRAHTHTQQIYTNAHKPKCMCNHPIRPP